MVLCNIILKKNYFEAGYEIKKARIRKLQYGRSQY